MCIDDISERKAKKILEWCIRKFNPEGKIEIDSNRIITKWPSSGGTCNFYKGSFYENSIHHDKIIHAYSYRSCLKKCLEIVTMGNRVVGGVFSKDDDTFIDNAIFIKPYATLESILIEMDLMKDEKHD